jgi:outer membrane receptor protein involved in Fe transport
MGVFLNRVRQAFFVLALTFVSFSSSAQVVVEEIIVTGLKRASSLLDAPVAVTVFTAKQIEASGVSRLLCVLQSLLLL